MSSTLCDYGQRREGQHNRYDKTLAETLSSLQQASFKMEDIKLLLFHFSFPFETERDEGKEEEGREKSLRSRTAEQAYETAPTDAIRVEFSSSCKHE